jgi:uncharacterized membrane protein YbhN (UPF0104 family)
VRGEAIFYRLVREPKEWRYLAIAQGLVIAGISLNFVRWFLLVRALGLDFHLRDALRLGTLGHLLNQVSPGAVGGDLFKAVFIAREQPQRRTEAVASIVIDRVVGLYGMLLVASCGWLLLSDDATPNPALETMSRVAMAFAAAGTVGIAALMTPALTGPGVQSAVARVPAIGATLARLVEAASAYRTRRRFLFAAILLACTTHTLLVSSLWFIGLGLPVWAPSLAKTFLIGPVSLMAGAIPLTPAGLGTTEAAMNYLFLQVGARDGDGMFVAITYRVMTYVMAAVGAMYYLNARRTVAQVMHEAEDYVEHHADAGPEPAV